MIGNNFFQDVAEMGAALAAQSIGQATVNGSEIKEPWRKGRQLAIIAVGGVFGTASSGRLRIQGLKRSDGTTWETLKESDGTTDLEFTATDLDDTAALENGALLGTLDLTRIEGDTYKSLRVTYEQETAAVTQLVAIGYMVVDAYKHPSDYADQLWIKKHRKAS